jgi:hypothetical protein
MKRNFIIGFFGLSAAALLGCPVFSGGGGGTGPCGSSPGSGQYDNGEGCSCYLPNDCEPGESCTDGVCQPSFGDGGFSEGSSEAGGGACDGGCGKGEVCAVVDAAAVCIPAGDGGGGKDGATDGPVFKGCTSNASCASAGAGYICLDGTCVAPANQCTDTQQCPNNEQCVDGACVPGCNPAGPNTCPAGYSCASTGVCTGNPTPCGGADGGMACTGGTTCVDQHCVPKCSTGDVACTGGEVCVDNGCIPNQLPSFICMTDGQAGDGTKGNCAVGSVCLHHACYISCSTTDGDAAATTACDKATGDRFGLCKSVTESIADGGTGTFYVCSSSSSLGTDCSPTTPCTGSGQVCIDGFCE